MTVMAVRGRGYTLLAPVLPQDEQGIRQGTDPRFCPACQLRGFRVHLSRPGATFCPACRRERIRTAQRLWARTWHVQRREERERAKRTQQKSVE